MSCWTQHSKEMWSGGGGGGGGGIDQERVRKEARTGEIKRGEKMLKREQVLAET